MLTALSVRKPQNKSGISRLFGKIIGDRIKVETLCAENVSLKSITYISRRKHINWHRIDKIVGTQRNHLLCSADESLPISLGYRRFQGFDMGRRMCTNMALAVLQKAENAEKLTLGVIDPDASVTDFVSCALNYTDKVYVATTQYELYKQLAQQLLCSSGAVLYVSKNLCNIENCDVIVAPRRLYEKLNCKDGAVILSGEKPIAKQDTEVYFRYFFDLPNEWKKIKPPYLEDMYFASALYSYARIYELGSVVPRICSGSATVHTLASLKTLLNNMASKT